jgi:MFS family permease
MHKISNLGIFTLLFVSSLTIMVGTVIAPSLSGIVSHINFKYSPSWLITVPSLGVVLFAPFIGSLLNRLGTFKLVSYGLIPYGILGVMGAFITNDYLLILDRFLLGAATLAIQVSATAYIAELFSKELQIKMIAWQGMTIEIGGVIFLAIGGILGQIHWQFPFYIYLSAFICLFLVFITLPKPIPVNKEVITNLSHENKAKVQIIFCASLLAMMLFFVSIVSLPIYLPATYGFNESNTGYLLAFISLNAIITASQMPKMLQLIGDEKTVAMGFLFFMLGYCVLASNTSLLFLIVAAMCMGVGFGFTIPILNHMMIEASSLENKGKNLGLFSMGIFAGQFLSTFIQSISSNYIAVFSFSAILAFAIASLIFYSFHKLSKIPA